MKNTSLNIFCCFLTITILFYFYSFHFIPFALISMAIYFFIERTKVLTLVFATTGTILIYLQGFSNFSIENYINIISFNVDLDQYIFLILALSMIHAALLKLSLMPIKAFFDIKPLASVEHRLLTVQQINQTPASEQNDATLIGLNVSTKKPVYISDEDANLHTLVIGTTGSGKTVAIANIVESVIDRGKSLFYVDGKGDMNLAEHIQAYAYKKQRPFYLFSMVKGQLKYNPIASGGYTSKKDRIIELRTWSEDHYRKIAESYLQTVFKTLEHLNIPLDICSLATYLNPDELYQVARSTKNQAIANDIHQLEERQKDIIGLLAEIENLVTSEIGHLFNTLTGEVLVLEKALNENAIVYFCLQPLAFPIYASTLGKLIINDLKNLVAMQLTSMHKKTFYTIFDEFSVFAGDQVVHLINQGRAAGLCAVLATQSLSDIAKRGGQALVGQIVNNCNNYIIQRQNNPQDAEVLSDIIGTHESLEKTIYISSTQKPSSHVKMSRTYMIHPDEIKRLTQGFGILLKKQNFEVVKMMVRRGSMI